MPSALVHVAVVKVLFGRSAAWPAHASRVAVAATTLCNVVVAEQSRWKVQHAGSYLGTSGIWHVMMRRLLRFLLLSWCSSMTAVMMNGCTSGT